ncbi:SMI1/KNR4 family protein [Tissierella sp. MSJ-40]|uniref:SMI1/KNR4 family protein n=1 Tax=Tissierella simiarum TaxID=2841534 RepID=A0ABS6EAF4_9FIRM|nr:SMI1/KNR4 family protein [Tissierella simiarum]MBU5439163.1 SMI1/KNR4 family protein [Tissierella simiarum]
MYNYSVILTKWREILKKVSDFGGDARELIIEPCATQQEIEDKEKSLGFPLPSSFKEILLHFSKHVEFRWFLPDNANLPNEFKEIFAGEIGWSLDWIEDLTPFGLEIESHECVDLDLKHKLKFYDVGNGDILAFDMGSGVEPNIVYWSHEGEGVFYIAESFTSYLNKITDLYGVGSEMWQMQPFVDEYGINSNGSKANRWRNWFDTFSSISIDVARSDLDSLIKYVEFHGKIGKEELKALKHYEKNLVLEKVLERLKIVDECQKEILIQVIGEVLGIFVEDWVRLLWKDTIEIKPEFRSYLTSRCLPMQEGLSIVTSYVESLFAEKVKYYEARKHLCYFRNNKIIQWIKGYISDTTTKDDWYHLFACSQPTWGDIKEWLMLGGKYRMIAINALEYMTDSWSSTYIKDNYKVCNPPTIEEATSFLEEEKEKEILKSKKRVFDRIIQHLNLIL